MSHINLLPWRDELQQVRNKKFFAILGATVFSSVLVVLCAIQFLDYCLKTMELNLNFIDQSYSEVQKQIKKIQSLKKDKTDLMNRINVIQSLGIERIAAAQLLNNIPTVIPDSIYLNSLVRKKVDQTHELTQGTGTSIHGIDTSTSYRVVLNGIAVDNNGISTLLKSLSNIPWVSNVQLTQVKEASQNDMHQSAGFEFTVEFLQNLF